MTPVLPSIARLSAAERALLRVLRHAGPLERDALAAALSQTRPTCSRLIDKMAREKWLEKAGVGKSSGGRRPTLWDIVPTSAYAAGLAIEIGVIKAAVADVKGTILSRQEQEIDVEAGPETFVRTAADVLGNALSAARVPHEQVLGVGVTAPGVVDRGQGTLVFCAHYREVAWWPDFPLLRELQERLPVQFHIDYHSNAYLLGEHWFGAQRGVANMIYIPIETQGIGAGILIDGTVYRGAGGSAGEFGHMTIEQNGRLCRCGSRGCIEAYVSGSEIVRRAQEIRRAGGQSAIFNGLDGGDAPTMRHIVDAASSGDRIARGIVEEAGQVLGVGIANLVNLLNPALVIIGGDLARAGDVLLDPIRRVTKRRALEKPADEVRFLCADSSPDDVTRGTIAMVLHETFGSPCSVKIPPRGIDS